MVVHLKPTPASFDILDQDHDLGDRDFIENAAILNPAGPERDALNQLIRSRGFASLGTHAVRFAARSVLARHGTTTTEASRVLLSRLAIAGCQQPAYREYMAASVLRQPDDVTRYRTPETIARIALTTVSDLLDLLLRLPQLTAHPDRTRLEERVEAARALCGALAFGPAQLMAFDVAGTDGDPIAQGALLPESGIPDELIFQAVTQTSEVLFTAASILANRAAMHLAHDQAALAAAALHYASLVERPLISLLGILVSMEVSTWLEIRPFIERPGAIQSVSYAELKKIYPELKRISNHARYPKHEHAQSHWVRESLTEAIEIFERWQSMHGGIAARYTPGGSPGMRWLDDQVAPVRQRRRAAKTTLGSHEQVRDAEPAAPGRGCPIGY